MPTQKPLTIQEINEEIERIVRQELNFLTQDSYTSEWSETTKKDLVESIKSFYATQFSLLVGEIIGKNKPSKYEMIGTTAQYDSSRGYNQAKDEIRQRAKEMGLLEEKCYWSDSDGVRECRCGMFQDDGISDTRTCVKTSKANASGLEVKG
jgi:predicted unusual protein kinase regulating ubiquinone biosynthesis (AarF/ABC1/UbiB family)